MVTRFADNFVEAITDAMVPEVETRHTSPEEVLRDLNASREITRQARRQAMDHLHELRRVSLSEDQVRIAIQRALLEVGSKDE